MHYMEATYYFYKVSVNSYHLTHAMWLKVDRL